ncbi:hypothetical protein I3760_04G152900 [Carya illinoinensis]|nr:hypothetical protein I3760_04G152900 [Carya illinoinensis]
MEHSYGGEICVLGVYVIIIREMQRQREIEKKRRSSSTQRGLTMSKSNAHGPYGPASLLFGSAHQQASPPAAHDIK